MSKGQHDFTQGNIWRQLVAFSWPILLANLLQASYQFIDSLWVGNLLGGNALGAVNISGSILFVVLSFVIGINNAALTILSQQKGRGTEDGLKRYINAFVVLLTSVSIVLGVVGILFTEQLLNLLGTPEEMMAQAKAYLRINFIGILFLFGYNFISTVMRALGDSKTPLIFVTVAVLLNLVLDPVLISVVGWGIEGAAIATITSQGLAFLYGMYHVLRRKMVPFSRPKVPALREITLILNLGIPAGMQMAVISAGSAAILSVVTGFGGAVVAGFSAAQRLDSLLILPAQALSVAVSSMAGQNIGVRNWDRVSKISFHSVVYNLAIMFTIGIVVAIFAEFGIRLFIDEPEAVQFGKTYLQIVALCYPFLGINFVLNGVVRAAGAMYQVLVLNIISFWVLRFPLTAWFSSLFGEIGIGMGMGASFIISSMFAYLYYRFGKWREKELFSKEKES
jgi:putative MATE family efflux protein